jgi:hypothetical protein
VTSKAMVFSPMLRCSVMTSSGKLACCLRH